MRVKVGEQWHEVTADAAICVELSSADRRNIANMLPEATRYAVFSDSDRRSPEEKLAWMD